MKLSEIALENVKGYLRVSDSDEDTTITTILTSAKQYILSHTGLTAEQADSYEDLCIACLCLCADAFDNRYTAVKYDKINPIVSSILHMHSKNYL